MSLWRATLTSNLSIKGLGNSWQRAFYGSLTGDFASVEQVLDPSDYLGQLWNLVNSAVNQMQTSKVHFSVDEEIDTTFSKLSAIIANALVYRDFDRILRSIYNFLARKDSVLDVEAVAVIHILIPLVPIAKDIGGLFDSIISMFINIWMGMSARTNIKDTILKFPYIALVKDQSHQQLLLSQVLFEECLSLDKEEIFRIKTNCKKYFPHNFESSLQLMFQKTISQVEEPRLLLNLVHFTLYPLLLVQRHQSKQYTHPDLFTLEIVVALTRRFLATEQLVYYKSLLSAIDDSTESLDPESALVREYACYSHLLKLLQSYDEWNDELLKEPKINTGAEGFERILWERQHAHWKQQVDKLNNHVKKVHRRTIDVSDGIEWMDQQAIINLPTQLFLTTQDERQREAEVARSMGISIMQSIIENISKN